VPEGRRDGLCTRGYNAKKFERAPCGGAERSDGERRGGAKRRADRGLFATLGPQTLSPATLRVTGADTARVGSATVCPTARGSRTRDLAGLDNTILREKEMTATRLVHL
jgi:hypothetical protein